MPIYLLLMGGPGAGKGTQAQVLREKFGLPQIASGDLFRDNLKRETPLGKLADRKSTRLNSSHESVSRMPASA